MDNRIELSVIVPCFNLEPFIGDLLMSISQQKLAEDNVEYIFVLDSCTDNTRNIIEEYGVADQIIECSVHSCGLARNIGLEASHGEYIWFIDGDDWLIDDYAIASVIEFVKGKDMIKIPFLSDRYNRKCYAMVWQYCFNRELIGDIRFRAQQPAEDNDFMDKIFEKRASKNMEEFARALYFYRYLRQGSNMYRFIILQEDI